MFIRGNKFDAASITEWPYDDGKDYWSIEEEYNRWTKIPASTDLAPPVIPDGTHKLRDLFKFQEIDVQTTKLTGSDITVAQFLAEQNIDLETTLLTVKKDDTLKSRLARWAFNSGTSSTNSVATAQKFRNLVLMTLETYFRVHQNVVPPVIENALSDQDRLASQLFRVGLGHDLYIRSNTRGFTGLADGSVFFETAAAPEATGNVDLWRTQDRFLSYLNLLRLEGKNKRLDGSELRLFAAEKIDLALGTDFTKAVRAKLSLTRKSAVIPMASLRQIFPNPFTPEGFDRIGKRVGVSKDELIDANTVNHAWAILGGVTAASNAPGLTTFWNRQEIAGALAPTHPGPGNQFEDLGFISRFFVGIPAVKDRIKLVGDKMDQGLPDPNIYGLLISGKQTGGAVNFYRHILFDNYGVDSAKMIREGKFLQKLKPPQGL